jgi:hypothetical protein
MPPFSVIHLVGLLTIAISEAVVVWYSHLRDSGGSVDLV